MNVSKLHSLVEDEIIPHIEKLHEVNAQKNAGNATTMNVSKS
jgi:hypothetical protein